MKKTDRMLLILVLVNLAGALFGIYYYWDQLSATSPLLWLFVPDCPLYVFAFAIALMLMEVGKRNDALSFLISAGLLKYGIWTLFALSAFNSYFFSPRLALVNGALFILHIGMAAEALVLKERKLGIGALFISLGWFLLNDAIDYFGGAHPLLPPGADVSLVAIFSFASTLLLVPMLWLAKRKGWRINIIKQ